MGFEVPAKPVLSKIWALDAERRARELDAALQAAEAGGQVVIKPWADLLSRPSVPWNVEGVFQEIGLAQLVGPPGKHKSNLAIDLGMSVACGLESWMGFPIRRHGPVLYVALEGVHGLAERVRAWQVGHGLVDAAPDFSYTESSIDLGSRQSVDAIRRAVSAMGTPPVLIIIDTQARATPGRDENSNTEMGLVMNNCADLAEEFGSYILLVHHSGKSGPGARGASAQLAAVDASIQVDGDGRSFRVEKVKEAAGGQVCHFEAVEAAGSVYVRQVDLPAAMVQAVLERERAIIEFVKANPGASKSKVPAAIGGRKQVVLDEIADLLEQGRLENRGSDARPKLHVPSEKPS